MDAFLNSSMPAVYIVLNYTYSKGIDIGQSVAKGLFRLSLARSTRRHACSVMHGGERERESEEILAMEVFSFLFEKYFRRYSSFKGNNCLIHVFVGHGLNPSSLIRNWKDKWPISLLDHAALSSQASLSLL